MALCLLWNLLFLGIVQGLANQLLNIERNKKEREGSSLLSPFFQTCLIKERKIDMFNYKNDLYKAYSVEGLERGEYEGIVCYICKDKGSTNKGRVFESVHVDTASLANALGITLDRLEEIIWYNYNLKALTGVVIHVGSNNDVIANVLHANALKELAMILPLYVQLNNIAETMRNARLLVETIERRG